MDSAILLSWFRTGTLGVCLAWGLLSFARLYVLQARKDRLYERIRVEYPILWLRLGCPGKPFVCLTDSWHRIPAEVIDRSPLIFDWFHSSEPTWVAAYPALLDDYREVRRRLRSWNFLIVPICAALFLLAVFADRIPHH